MEVIKKMRWTQISRRVRNTIFRNIKKLEEKYGEEVVKRVVKKYYELKKEKKWREKRIKELEAELEILKETEK